MYKEQLYEIERELDQNKVENIMEQNNSSSYYDFLYNKKVCELEELLHLPLKEERAPDLSKSVKIWRRVSSLMPSEMSKISKRKINSEEIINLSNRTGKYREIKYEEGERWRAPLTIGKLLGLARMPDKYVKLKRMVDEPVVGRIPILFYELESGNLYLPFSKNTDPKKIVDDFVIPYLGVNNQSNLEHIKNLLHCRFANFRERNNRKRMNNEYADSINRVVFAEEGKKYKIMKKKDISNIGLGTRIADMTNSLLSKHGLSLDTAFLLPKVSIYDKDKLTDAIKEHLKKIDYLNRYD